MLTSTKRSPKHIESLREYLLKTSRILLSDQGRRFDRMPTFIIFKNARPISTIVGADHQKLSEAVKKLAAEANAIESDAGAFGGKSSGGYWIGGVMPKTYGDVTDQVIVKGIELLNRDSEKASAEVLFNAAKPASLGSSKGEDISDAEDKVDWVESDTDDQLMLFVPFNSTLKIHSLHITSLPPSSDEDVMRPRTLQLYTNRAHNLGFDEADGTEPEQIIELKPEDWDPKTGTATVETRLVKFQRVTSLVIFVVNGEGDGEKTRIDRVRIIGEAGEKREMGKLEKIGDEPGE